MTQTTKSPSHRATRSLLAKTCIFFPALCLFAACHVAQADTLNGGVLDELTFLDSKNTAASASRNNGKTQTNAKEQKELAKQIKKEQKELAKLARKELKQLADKGERLAQVELANEFAAEAQSLTFAPAAANAALSDALKWYSLAAKRGYPGAPALDTSGVSVFPIRVVRNQ